MATTVTTTPVTPADIRHQPSEPVHTHGEMEVRAHERTFDGFVRFLTWNAVLIAVILIFLALANA